MMVKFKIGFVIVLFVFISVFSLKAQDDKSVLALWVPCESSNQTFSSKKKIDDLISLSRKMDVKILFVQVYRRNHSWYPSKMANPLPYSEFKKREGFAPISYLIKRAHLKGIEVHIWFNVLWIGKDPNVPILNNLGVDIVTRDNRNRSMLDYKNFEIPLPEGDYYSYAADGIWLDPGDKRVQNYMINVFNEALAVLPAADGIHLDFIRYPFVSPSAPGSFYERKGISFGYGRESTKEFQRQMGLNVFDMPRTKKNAYLWDEWRRSRITLLMKKTKSFLLKYHPHKRLSCAVLPWPERIYFNSFQDWPDWIEKGFVDFVALMNYSTDQKLARFLSKMAVGVGGPSKVWIGLGAYLLRKDIHKLKSEISDAKNTNTNAIVLFSYDSLLKNTEMQEMISKAFSKEQ